MQNQGKKMVVEEKVIKPHASFGHSGRPLINKDNCPMVSDFELGTASYSAKEFPKVKTHPDEEALFIYSGKGIIRVGDNTFPIKAGTAIYIPANTPHCIKKIGKSPLKAVYCHSGVIKHVKE